MVLTTLGKRALNQEVSVRLVGHIERQAESATEIFDPGDHVRQRHIGALKRLANELGPYGPHPTDPRAYALWLIAGAFGEVDRFIPTKRQSDLLHTFGEALGDDVGADVTLSELVAAGLEDYIEYAEQLLKGTRKERDEALENSAGLAESEQETARLSGEMEKAQETIAGLEEELTKRQQTIDYLQQMGGGSASEESGATGQGVPDKTKIEKGVYRTAAGKLKIVWTNTEGRQRWHTLGDGADLQQARTLRSQLGGTDREPSEVAA